MYVGSVVTWSEPFYERADVHWTRAGAGVEGCPASRKPRAAALQAPEPRGRVLTGHQYLVLCRPGCEPGRHLCIGSRQVEMCLEPWPAVISEAGQSSRVAVRPRRPRVRILFCHLLATDLGQVTRPLYITGHDGNGARPLGVLRSQLGAVCPVRMKACVQLQRGSWSSTLHPRWKDAGDQASRVPVARGWFRFDLRFGVWLPMSDVHLHLLSVG